MGAPEGGALGPDVWYPTIPGSPEEKDLGSLIQPRRGGGGTTVPHCLNHIP